MTTSTAAEAGAAGREGRARRKRGGGGEERTAADSRKLCAAWFPMLTAVPHIARMQRLAQTLRLSFGQQRRHP